jgi:hypothetical protein
MGAMCGYRYTDKLKEMNKIEQPKINLDDIVLIPDGVKVKITKESERDDAKVPNNIPCGDTRIGYIRKQLLMPIIGMRYGLESVIEENGVEQSPNTWFMTSTVTEILSVKGTNDKAVIMFKTLNSVYKVEVL